MFAGKGCLLSAQLMMVQKMRRRVASLKSVMEMVEKWRA
jgi:hypothetical protein